MSSSSIRTKHNYLKTLRIIINYKVSMERRNNYRIMNQPMSFPLNSELLETGLIDKQYTSARDKTSLETLQIVIILMWFNLSGNCFRLCDQYNDQQVHLCSLIMTGPVNTLVNDKCYCSTEKMGKSFLLRLNMLIIILEHLLYTAFILIFKHTKSEYYFFCQTVWTWRRLTLYSSYHLLDMWHNNWDQNKLVW